MTTTSTPSTTATTLRLPTDQFDALRGYASRRGRPLAEELRRAVRIHLRNLALAHVHSAEGQAEVRALGLNIEDEKQMITESLQALSASTFGPYVHPDYRVT